MTLTTKHLYVNVPGKTPLFSSVSAALDSVAFEAEDASYPAPLREDVEPVVVHIGPGTYRERFTVTRPNVTLQGEGASRSDVVLVYGDYGREILSDGIKRGTFRSATVRIAAQDFTARHLTFQNDAGYGYKVGQAVALYVDGDRCYLEDCALLGSQDTLFTAPLPLKEVEPGGFRGPGENKPRILGRHCYRNCYIQGDVDFIFGGGICYFENCEIFSKNPDGKELPEGAASLRGYITAASTPEGEPFGYVLKDCHLTSDCPPHTVMLGRPWREFAKTVYINCELGEHIHPTGWMDWGKDHSHFYYGEFGSYGPGANPEARADFSHQLTAEEAAKYTTENVFKGWIPGV